jgi:hypothetical protein
MTLEVIAAAMSRFLIAELACPKNHVIDFGSLRTDDLGVSHPHGALSRVVDFIG